ncbi:Uncharacterised protein [Bordetella pertussis]|nr:Uncharacterised protein [Bordetella pertussis]
MRMSGASRSMLRGVTPSPARIAALMPTRSGTMRVTVQRIWCCSSAARAISR